MIYLQTCVERRFKTQEEAVKFGIQMDAYGSTPALPDSIGKDGDKFTVTKYHKHDVVTDISVFLKLQAEGNVPALFPHQSFVDIETEL